MHQSPHAEPASLRVSSGKGPRSIWPALGFLAVVAIYCGLVWRLEFVCDDAYISFRYARNLVHGAGFVFNPGVDGPVEGSSELLWVIALMPFEALGLDLSLWSCVLSIVCGLLLIFDVRRTLDSDLSLSAEATFLGTLFAGTMPVFAAWSSGGMATMPFALALFELYRRLLVGALPVRASVCASLSLVCLLLRPESAPWILCMLGLGWSFGRKQGEPSRSRAAGIATLAFVAASALLVAWRMYYFGYPLPNTVYAKVGLTAGQFSRGLGYLLRFAIVFPLTLLAVVSLAATLLARRRMLRSSAVIGALACSLLCVLFSIAAGGDFMAMFRFAVPAIAFLAVLLALAFDAWEIERPLARRIALGAAALVCAANLGVAFGFEPLRLPMRRLRPQSGKFQVQIAELRWQRHDSGLWSDLGRALAVAAPQGASLVARGLGALSYHSGLTIFDQHGLVSAEVAHSKTERIQSAAGHDLFLPIAFFEPRKPTYAYAGLHSAKELDHVDKLLLHRIFSHPDDVDAPSRYRPVVMFAPWLEREEQYLLVAQRVESGAGDASLWDRPLLGAGEVRQLPAPAK